MKLLHTADWHLGKTLNGVNLIDDQDFILKKFLKLVDDEKPETIIISGDIYDRADPSTNAIELFDEILFKLTEKKIPVLCIAGNHDSAERLNFGSRLFANKKFFITAKTDFEPKIITIDDNFGEIYFSLIPFFEPGEIRNKFFGENAERMSFDAANKFYITEARKKIPKGKRSVAIAHVYVDGGIESDSERKFIGTAGKVSPETFSEYDYAALGHLHKPQNVFSDKIRYSGSLLKYSAKEFDHKKGFTLVELDKNGFLSAKNIELKPKHDLISISGTLAEFQARKKDNSYAYITLTDNEFVYDAAQKLREIFPNLMDAKNKSRPNSIISAPERKFRENSTILEQFSDFFESMTHRTLTENEIAALNEICGG